MSDADPISLVARDDAGAHSGGVVAENVAALKALFPSIVTDGQVDFDVLRQLLGDAVEEGEERYGLNWRGKRRARAFALTPTLATLRPAKGESKDWDGTRNMVIEGDNLEVLKCLRRSYAGQVKLIYIDPPYNTGNDFVYPDNYADSLGNYERLTGQRGDDGAAMTTNKEASGRFHTDWLNMMYPRLMLAKELLRDDGVVVTHLDEHEVDSLVLVMKELLGGENYLGTLVWDKRNPKGDAEGLAYQHESLIFFAKNLSRFAEGEDLKREKNGASSMLAAAADLLSSKSLNEARQAFKAWVAAQPELSGGERMYNMIKDDHRVYRLVSMAWPNKKQAPDDYFIPLTHPVTKKPCPVPERGWRNPPATMKALLQQGRIEFGPDHKTQPQRIYFLDENMTENVPSVVPYGGSDDALMKELGIVFDQPKPVALARKMISWTSRDDDLILDFFAGSGTTGHAVMAQNAADGGNRRYILVQLPEPLDLANASQNTAADFCDTLGRPRTIAELTKERLRRAGAKVAAENPEKTIDTGFRVYKLATSNLKPWQPDPDNLAQSLLDAVDNILPDRSEDDLLVELLLKTGIDLTLPMATRTICQRPVHALGGGVLIVYLGDVSDADAEDVGQGIADWYAELDPIRKTTFYFRDSGFATAAAKANVAAIIRQRVGGQVERLASI